MGSEEDGGLFGTEKGGRLRSVGYKVLAGSMFAAIWMIWVYRLLYYPGKECKEWVWIGMMMAELWMALYWLIAQSHRWNNTSRHPFINKLLRKYGDKLPGVDIFVCTADASIEPPTMVVNTVLSLMSYNYPPEKLAIYLSDDACSLLTFYALLEASNFANHWIPFCNKHAIEPRCPEAYFAQPLDTNQIHRPPQCLAIKEVYEEMKRKIEEAIETGSVSEEVREKHKGFSEWRPEVTKSSHQSIVQVVIDGRDPNSVDNSGRRLPTVVYMAREKKPHSPHNFKAGAMNALIRVSAEISNAPIILNVDCDMYSNHSDTILESLCFFMDEEKGHRVGYVQYPQNFSNITVNDLYSNSLKVSNQVESTGIDGYDAALFCGTGCFHRRDSLRGMKYEQDSVWGLKGNLVANGRAVGELEEAGKNVSSCSYEHDSMWGKEMGVVYGCPVEDIITGMKIQGNGWKPIYYNPSREAFLGVAPASLESCLVQYKRWSEGLFQVFLSKYCPFVYGRGKIPLGGQLGSCVYLLWAPTSLPLLYYLTLPSLCFLRGISLFPHLTTFWFMPFAYVFIARNCYGLFESLQCGHTLKGWWISQQMWMFRRTSSFFLAFVDTILNQLGLGDTGFVVTSKVMTEEVAERYRKEVWEFGSASPMFTILATLAMLNLFCLVGGIWKMGVSGWERIGDLGSQMGVCGVLVLINHPLYGALFVRKDNGALPSSVLVKSVCLASLACVLFPLFI